MSDRHADAGEKAHLARYATGAVMRRSIGQLCGQMAHDLNNLLAVTLSSVEIAARIDDPAKVRDFLETAIRTIHLQREFTDKMARASRSFENPERIDVHRIVAELADDVGAGDSSVRMALRCEAQQSHVRCDQRFLVDALRNVLFVACSAMPGGGLLSISTRNAGKAGASGAAADHVLLAVTDSGEGMADDARRKAFDLFSGPHGADVYLAQARDTARRIGGYASIESAPGAGTTITLGLPLAADA